MSLSVGAAGMNPLLPPGAGASASRMSSLAGKDGASSDFSRMLVDSLNSTAGMQNRADQLVQQGIAEGDVSQVETLASIKKAELSLKMMMQIRNKLMDAYSEIRQMQL